MTATRIKPEMRQKARSLRKALTRGEVLLWLEMRELKSAGLHFRKQAAIGVYVVDFVCHAARIVVEVDGDLHETAAGKRHDENRDAYLKSLGYRVVRFDYPDVLANPWHCAQLVKEQAVSGGGDPTRPLRGHPPLKGEGAPRRPVHSVER